MYGLSKKRVSVFPIALLLLAFFISDSLAGTGGEIPDIPDYDITVIAIAYNTTGQRTDIEAIPTYDRMFAHPVDIQSYLTGTRRSNGSVGYGRGTASLTVANSTLFQYQIDASDLANGSTMQNPYNEQTIPQNSIASVNALMNGCGTRITSVRHRCVFSVD